MDMKNEAEFLLMEEEGACEVPLLTAKLRSTKVRGVAADVGLSKVWGNFRASVKLTVHITELVVIL